MINRILKVFGPRAASRQHKRIDQYCTGYDGPSQNFTEHVQSRNGVRTDATDRVTREHHYYHFMPEFLKKWAPSRFTDASTFTAVVRWEQVNTDTDDRTKQNALGGQRKLERLTLGLNFRPIEDTVIKFDWQFNTQKDAKGLVAAGDLGAAGSPLNGNGFLIQAATYF